MPAITNALAGVIQWLYGIIHSHGWAIVVFTLLVRIVLMPLDISSRKGMRKMAKIQPQLSALQKKYANDRAKLQQKQSELMRKERYNPLSGCLPMLIQLPVLFAMFGAMRAIADEQIVRQVFTFLEGGTPTYEGWLWVRNIWMPDSLFAPVAPMLSSIQPIGFEVWQSVWNALSEASRQTILQNVTLYVQDFGGTLNFATADGLKLALPSLTAAMQQMDAYKAAVALMPGFKNINLFLFSIQVYVQHNGLLILPVLAGVSQMFMAKVNPQAAGQQPGAQGQTPGMGNFMKYFFPLFSVYICLTSTAAFALYWVVSNLIATGMSYFINIYFDRKDKLTQAQTPLEGTVK